MSRAVWQISGGPASRSYADVFVKHGVALIGPRRGARSDSARREDMQVVVTTHSPEVLDAKWIRPEHLRVVEWATAPPASERSRKPHETPSGIT